MGIFSKLFNLNVKSDVEENKIYEAIDNSIDADGDFLMFVDDVFTITGRGTVVTGCISSGEVHVGDTLYINEEMTTIVTGIEQFRKQIVSAKAGENVGILLSEINRDDIKKGDMLTKKDL